jgi:hypothetical protein
MRQRGFGSIRGVPDSYIQHSLPNVKSTSLSAAYWYMAAQFCAAKPEETSLKREKYYQVLGLRPARDDGYRVT